MTNLSWWQMVPWYAVALYWGVSAFRGQTDESGGTDNSPSSTACLAATTFVLLFSNFVRALAV